MAPPQLNQETLMAYVDGALDVETKRIVEAAAEEDEAIAEQIAALRRTREASRDALAPLLDETVPDALAASVRAFAERHPKTSAQASPEQSEGVTGAKGAIVPMRRREPSESQPRIRLGIGLAASLALAVGVGAGFFAGGGRTPFGERIEPVQFDQAGLVDAIYSAPSGEAVALPDGNAFRAIATFAVGDGTLCREFEIDGVEANTVVAVACHLDGRWRARFAVASAAPTEAYAPAASLEVLQAYLSAVGAEAPLDPAAEAAALDDLR